MKIIILALVFSLTAFADRPTPFTDKWTQEKSSFYPESYRNSRDRFLQMTEGISSLRFQMTKFKVPSAVDQDLSVDIAYLPAAKPQNLIVIMTGVHGGEGYAANAVMAQFMDSIFPKLQKSNTGFVFVHALNPYGFKYFQRTTENHVDLNRNFPVKPNLYESKNTPYESVRSLLIEEAPLNISSLGNILMLPRVGWVLLTKPKGYLLQATAGGQYHDDKGVFYGGQKPEPQVAFFAEYLSKTAKPYQNIYYVDLHTGYGKKGVLHLFGSGALSEKHKTFTEKVFGLEKIDYGSNKDFYSTSGDSVAFVSSIFPDKNVASMCFEFGTLDSQTTLGSFKSLQTLRFESQGAHFGFATEKDRTESLEKSVRMFAPQEDEWRKQVLAQGKETFVSSIENFLKEGKTK